MMCLVKEDVWNVFPLIGCVHSVSKRNNLKVNFSFTSSGQPLILRSHVTTMAEQQFIVDQGSSYPSSQFMASFLTNFDGFFHFLAKTFLLYFNSWSEKVNKKSGNNFHSISRKILVYISNIELRMPLYLCRFVRRSSGQVQKVAPLTRQCHKAQLLHY